MINAEKYFANRVKTLEGSAIRAIFKLLEQGDVISLAGGSPAPESFPAQELAEISKEILTQKPHIALQYSVTEGYTPLRELLKKRMAEKFNSFKSETDDLIVTCGAQQGIDLAMKVLINEGDIIAVEEPSFIGTLNSARSYGAVLKGVPVDEDGMNMEKLEQLLKSEKVKLIYTISTFQNPSGITMSLEKRKKLIELAEKYDVLILEDNPYGELRFRGDAVPTIKSFDKDGRVLYAGTFSKILSAGMRLGWICADKNLLARIIVVKQVNDVHTPVLTQMMAYEYMSRYSIDDHIAKISKLYERKCNAMLEAMDKYLAEKCTYTRPEGGIFLQCTMPEGTDTKALLEKATKNGVAFVPGNSFMVDMSKPANTFRLNYSLVPEDKIETAIRLLAEVM